MFWKKRAVHRKVSKSMREKSDEGKETEFFRMTKYLCYVENLAIARFFVVGNKNSVYRFLVFAHFSHSL